MEWRLHNWTRGATFMAFPILYVFPWNRIYPGLVAMALGAGAQPQSGSVPTEPLFVPEY